MGCVCCVRGLGVKTMDIVQPSGSVPTNDELARWRADSPLLDFRHPAIQELVARRGWMQLSEHERIGAVYNFVRDDRQGAAEGRDQWHCLPTCAARHHPQLG